MVKKDRLGKLIVTEMVGKCSAIIEPLCSSTCSQKFAIGTHPKINQSSLQLWSIFLPNPVSYIVILLLRLHLDLWRSCRVSDQNCAFIFSCPYSCSMCRLWNCTLRDFQHPYVFVIRKPSGRTVALGSTQPLTERVSAVFDGWGRGGVNASGA
jgi:hypothetical protein